MCIFENWNKMSVTSQNFLRCLIRGLCFLVCFWSIHINLGAGNGSGGIIGV